MKTIEKVASHAFGKDVYLLGIKKVLPILHFSLRKRQ